MIDRTAQRLMLAALALLAGLPTSGCKARDATTPDAVVTVQTAHPVQASLSEEIAADAILAPLSQAAIAPRISAPIRAEYVERGTRVRKGQLLVSLEDRDLQGNALDSRGALVSAQASYTTATEATIPEDVKKAEMEFAQLAAARDVAARASSERRTLFDQGAISGRDADTAFAAAVQAQASYDTALKHLESVRKTTQRTSGDVARGQLTSAKGRAAAAEAQASYAALRSPIDGVVIERPLFPGETASAGSAVITVMDTSSLLAKLHLAQSAAQKLTLGHKADVQVPGVEDVVEAFVSFISPALDPGSTTVEVWLKLPNRDGHLKVGTAVHAVIVGTTVQNALQIPKSAVLPSQDGGTAVMVVGQDSTVHKRAVTVGIRTGDVVQILSGLAAADMVVTNGGYGLDDGTKVSMGKPGAGEDKE